MRYLENNFCKAAVLVSAYDCHFGIEDEMYSGYFNESWSWKRIKQNAKHIAVIASRDDPIIDINIPRKIAKNIDARLYDLPTGGHFQDDNLPYVMEFLSETIGIR